jgi:hypothetical protein
VDPKLSLDASLISLLFAMIFTSLSTIYLIGSIDGFVESSGLSRTFVASFLLSGSAAEVINVNV